MKMKGLFLLGILFLAVYPIAAVVPPPPAPAPLTRPNPSNMMSPVAQSSLNTALQLRSEAHSLLDQATEKELDVSSIADSIARADALLEEAQKIVRVNPIPALSRIREAINMYNKAIADLKQVLS